ncbi:hypothetical protein F2Q69_00061174 [Brassica cretica]|uniref:Uncharacterized protein n=1 Tax=Brassica cretica TaxID=69181 RepID=A0A8S9RE51_BRACR|nr:hypothetical protein F2Q69_00061174 [Brassica cretica]
MVTPIKTKQETFRSRFEGEHRDGGQTGCYVASGSKLRRVLLVFVVKSQRKLRLRRNEKRFDENSNENAKEDLYEALQVATSQLLARSGIKEAAARGSVAAARASRVAGGWLCRRWSGGGLRRRRRGSARAGLRLMSLLWLNPRETSPFISNGRGYVRVSSSWASCT